MVPMVLNLFAIRVVGTNKVFLTNDRGIPFTHAEPMDPSNLTAGKIRLFRTYRSAKLAAEWWKSGTFVSTEDGIEHCGNIPHRASMELEIIPVEVTIPPNQ